LWKRENFLKATHKGRVAYKDHLGFFIQPADDEIALVGFNNVDPNELPEGFAVGDKVEFVLDQKSKGVNASKWSKVEENKD